MQYAHLHQVLHQVAVSHRIYASLLQLQIYMFEQYDLLLPCSTYWFCSLFCNNLCKFFSSFIHFCATFSKIVARSYADNVFISFMAFLQQQQPLLHLLPFLAQFPLMFLQNMVRIMVYTCLQTSISIYI